MPKLRLHYGQNGGRRLGMAFKRLLTLAYRINPLTPNDLERRSAVNPLKIKISSKNMREKPTNTPFIHSVY
jgi:hypothetical protein